MFSFDQDDEGAVKRTTRPDCPGCGAQDLAGDDFCHACGHSFEHFATSRLDEDDDGAVDACPMCASGQLVAHDYGRTQCDSCGYTARIEG